MLWLETNIFMRFNMLEILSIDIPPILKLLGASIGGSIIGRRFRSRMSAMVFLSSMCSSMIIAVTLGPVLVKFFGGWEYALAVGVCIGMFGLAICDTIEKLIKTADWQIVRELIKAIKGGGD